MNFKQWILNEAFDTISDFLLNPDNRYKNWNQIIEEFKASGGEVLGVGSHAEVYSHPSWKYVVKVYANDPIYTKFVRFAYNHSDSVFPKFFGLPQKIVPEYTRPKSMATLNLVRMERLQPIDKKLAEQILNNLYSAVNYLNNPTTPARIGFKFTHTQEEDYYATRNLMPIRQLLQNPRIKEFYEGCRNLIKFQGGALDMASNNIMQRQNGELVFADPFWEGSNPYADAARVRDMETDSYSDYEPVMYPGGKLPTKPKKKKVKMSNQINPNYDNTPF
jgi:hypothetical protein